MSTPETLFDASELTVSMGPQHPSTHGVLQVKLKLDGERVIDAIDFSETHGEVCPANWKQGDKAMKPNAESLKQYMSKG